MGCIAILALLVSAVGQPQLPPPAQMPVIQLAAQGPTQETQSLGNLLGTVSLRADAVALAVLMRSGIVTETQSRPQTSRDVTCRQ